MMDGACALHCSAPTQQLQRLACPQVLRGKSEQASGSMAAAAAAAHGMALLQFAVFLSDTRTIADLPIYALRTISIPTHSVSDKDKLHL